MKRWAVFISGRGSNLQTLLDGLEENRIVLVISSSAKAPGILKARRLGIPVAIFNKKINWSELHQVLKQHSVQRIFLAGFMKIIPAEFIENWAGRILNVHPSLLPAFPGLQAIEKSFADGAAMGVTVHVVTPEMDAGPQVLQKTAVTADLRQKSEQKALTLSEAEFLISITEQSLVRESFRRWN
jgi:phosphoribosylglycinamide formyltransferase-1